MVFKVKRGAATTTRDRIMQMLKTDGELTAREMTERLGITGMGVRRHIDALERSGLIESRTIRQPMGRPASLYRLTEQADHYFPKNYHGIALDLLGELAQEAGEPVVNRLFERRKQTLYRKYAGKMTGERLADKVSALADIQNENGYMAQWEQSGDDEFVLTEYNCPISQIANAYNHACKCELDLFESLLGAEVSRTECLAKGGQKCAYTIRKRAASPN
ncbi:transcriptional regulator [Paenibacillus cisolokensis]|uniref:Transcriptional regulator n=1 Tax=Paenibacillus cisolokensis TaxID=1658519 RepID=A0ABQ4N598_9BACL|nr:transcriptional regulator [Paenibacillus cisolokensis]